LKGGFSSNFKSSALSHESYGYGNLTFCKDASFCESAELADLLKEEQFLSSNSEKKKLIDEAEKQHDQMFPDKPDNSFINATTSQVEMQKMKLMQSSQAHFLPLLVRASSYFVPVILFPAQHLSFGFS